MARIDQLCASLDGTIDRPLLHQLRVRLREPLRVAIVGRVSTGKSTLVNALVGRRIAPTSAGECTRVVTWYRYGESDQAQVVLRDGTTRALKLHDRALPEELGVPVGEVDRLEVTLSARALRSVTLIDTPGLDTLTAENESATRRAVLGDEASEAAARDADALLFLIGTAARSGDLDFLADFQTSTGGLPATSLNAIGVLCQADAFGDGPFDTRNPFDLAREQAGRLAAAHAAALADVVPVSGLLAETATTGRVSEAVARQLADLADEDPVALSLRRQDPDLVDLNRLFGPHGIDAGRAPARSGAAELKQWCVETSGVAALESVLASRLVPRSDVLKAGRALGDLQAAAAGLSGADRTQALDLIEAATLDPALHVLDELRMLYRLLTEAPHSPLVAQLTAFVDRHDLAGLLGAGGAGAPRAMELSTEATRTASLALSGVEAAAARTLARSYHLLADRIGSVPEYR